MLFPPYPALLFKPAGTIKVGLPADRKEVGRRRKALDQVSEVLDSGSISALFQSCSLAKPFNPTGLSFLTSNREAQTMSSMGYEV